MATHNLSFGASVSLSPSAAAWQMSEPVIAIIIDLMSHKSSSIIIFY